MTLSAAEPSSQAARFCLVVGLKLDDGGAFAVEEAVRVARRIPRCALHLVHVVDGVSAVDVSELTGHLRLYANEKVKSLGGAHEMTIGIHVRAGEVSVVLADFVGVVGADLLIVGSDKHHPLSWYRAALVERLLEAASCPVVVAGPKPRPRAAADASSTIEPPCPACVQARADSHGATWWCSQHSDATIRPHAFSYQRELPLRTPDTLVFPTGMGG
jgi:nucleotide-binding universal stress UspA family protein